MRERGVVLLACFAAAGCDAAVLTGRPTSDVYEFALPGNPSRVLRWASGTDVKVFVATGGGGTRDALLADSFQQGAASWNALAHFGEFQLSRTENAGDADAVLAWSDLQIVDTSQCRPALSRAVTTFCLDTVTSRLRVFPLQGGNRSRVKMLVTVLATEAVVPDRVPRLVAHELGHVLGIAQHSPNPLDLMWRIDPDATRPSVRDAATVQVLYHMRPDIVP